MTAPPEPTPAQPADPEFDAELNKRKVQMMAEYAEQPASDGLVERLRYEAQRLDVFLLDEAADRIVDLERQLAESRQEGADEARLDEWLSSPRPILSEQELGAMTAADFDIERYIASLTYGPDTPEIAKTVVAANLRNLNFVLSHKHNHDMKAALRAAAPTKGGGDEVPNGNL